MAEGREENQKLLSKTPNFWSFDGSGSDSDGEYMADDIYSRFWVTEMFSDELDLFSQAKNFNEDSPGTSASGGHLFENGEIGVGVGARVQITLETSDDDQVVTDYLPPTPAAGNSPLSSLEPGDELQLGLVGEIGNEIAVGREANGSGEHDQSLRLPAAVGGTSRQRSFEKDVVSDCPSSNDDANLEAAGAASGGGDSGMSDHSLARHLSEIGDNLHDVSQGQGDTGTAGKPRRTVSTPNPSPTTLGLGGAEGGPDDIQHGARSHSQGYVPARHSPRQPDFQAVSHNDLIVLTAKKLRLSGDVILRQYEEGMRAADAKEPLHISHWQKLKSCMRSVMDAIDATLTWVEHHSMEMMKNVKDMKKQEGILRGLTLLTDISQRVSSIAIIQMACQYLDVPNEVFAAERSAVRRSIDQVEKEIEDITEKSERASELLCQIIDLCDNVKDVEEFRKITKQFDNAVREANLTIRSCDIRLEGANKNIKSLLFKINSVRWFHRGIRGIGFGLTAYYFYGKHCDGSINKTTAFLAGGVSLIGWLAMFPTRTYEYYDQLNNLQQQHDEMRLSLQILKEKIGSAKDYKREVTRNKRN